MRSALPDAEFLEQHYSHEDVLVLEELRSKLDQMADPAVRNEWGRRALRQFWDDELEWIEHTHFIVNKSSQVQLFKVNYAQRQFYKDVIVRCRDEGRPIRAVILKGRQLGFCGAPSHRVLTADLRWVTLDEIKIGTEIVGVDEHIPGGRGAARKMRTARVEGKRDVWEEALRFKMSNGVDLVLTKPHRMLCKKRGGSEMVWRRADSISVGDEIRLVTEPWADPGVEDGWFGGMLDGEGSFDGFASPSVCVCQLRGPVWDRMETYLRERGYHYCIESDKTHRPSKFGRNPCPKLVIGRMSELFRLLGQTRPTRFIHRRWWEGRDLPGKRVGNGTATVVSVEAVPVQRMVDLQTSTGTFILEGFVSHNSTFIQSWQYEQCDANPNRYSMTINYNEPMTEELFQKAKTIHDRLFFPRSLARARKDQLQFASPHSSIFHTETAGNLNAGRSLTLHHLHCSEVPMWPNGDEVVTSVHQSVPQLLSSSIFHESTAKGAQGAFYEYWNDAVAGRNNFVPFFAPWYWDPTYIQEFPSRDHERKFASTLSPQDLRYMEKYRLSIPQMAWRRWKIDNDLKGSERRFRQEYPADAEEAFLTTGSPAFDPEAVRDLTFQAAPPTWIGSITLAQT